MKDMDIAFERTCVAFVDTSEFLVPGTGSWALDPRASRLCSTIWSNCEAELNFRSRKPLKRNEKD